MVTETFETGIAPKYKEALWKDFFSNQKEIYIWSSTSNTLSLCSRISYQNSTEQSKLAPDHFTKPLFRFHFEPFSWSFTANVEAEDSYTLFKHLKDKWVGDLDKV